MKKCQSLPGKHGGFRIAAISGAIGASGRNYSVTVVDSLDRIIRTGRVSANLEVFFVVRFSIF